MYIFNISFNGLSDLTTIEEKTEPITTILEDNQPNLVKKNRPNAAVLRSKMKEWLKGMCGMEVESKHLYDSRKSEYRGERVEINNDSHWSSISYL